MTGSGRGGIASEAPTAPARELRLVGAWPLAGLLGQVVADRGHPFTRVAGAGPPRLELVAGRDTRAVQLPDAMDLRWAIATSGLTTLLAHCGPFTGTVECTILAPAAGWCGPSDTGPVDALRFEGVREVLVPLGGPVCRAVLITAPQSRCWVMTCYWEGTDPVPRRPPGPDLRLVHGLPAADTARLTQHMYDLGLGREWRPVAVLDTVRAGPAGRVAVVAAFTDAPFVEDLVDAVLGTERGGRG